MIVLQPLIQGLRGIKIYCKVYESKEGYPVIDLGTQLKPFWEVDNKGVEVIFGNPATKTEISYKLLEDHYEKEVGPNRISEFDLVKIERLLDSCYNFEEEHKVTDWK